MELNTILASAAPRRCRGCKVFVCAEKEEIENSKNTQEGGKRPPIHEYRFTLLVNMIQ